MINNISSDCCLYHMTGNDLPLCCWQLIWPIQNYAKNLKNVWNHDKWVLIWEYSARAFQWVPTWQGLDGFQHFMHFFPWVKVASALQGLRTSATFLGSTCWDSLLYSHHTTLPVVSQGIILKFHEKNAQHVIMCDAHGVEGSMCTKNISK